jgi:hypothetical protein
MLWLETERLQLIITLLIARFPLRVLLLLQLEDFLEWSSGQRGWDVVFAVKVLCIKYVSGVRCRGKLLVCR